MDHGQLMKKKFEFKEKAKVRVRPVLRIKNKSLK